MNRSQHQICLEITRELQSRPASTPFLKPVDLEKFPNYLEYVDDPMDLETIEKKLLNHDYRSVREWKKDIALIWENCFAFAGSSSATGTLAQHLKSLFEKKYSKMSITYLDGWLSRMNEARRELNEIIKNPPINVKGNAPLDSLSRESLQPMMPDDYVDIMKQIQALPNEEDRVKVQNLLGNPSSELDLPFVELNILHEAKQFLKSKAPVSVRRSLMDVKPLANHEI